MIPEVKVCGMTTPENTGLVAHLQPEYLGVILVPTSLRCVHDLAQIDRIKKVAGYSKLVAVIRAPSADVLEYIRSTECFWAVQIHSEDFNEIASSLVTNRSTEMWQSISINSSSKGCELSISTHADRVIFDGAVPGSGAEFNWGALNGCNWNKPFMIAGGVGPENIRRLLDTFKNDTYFGGVDINSKVEISPGLKDVQLVDQVIKEVRNGK